MPKMKTHRGAAKRLRKTGSGKLKLIEVLLKDSKRLELEN